MQIVRLLILLLSFAALPAMAEKPTDPVADKVQSLDKDVAVLKESTSVQFAAQDKRIGDLQTSVAGQVSEASNNLSQAGNTLSLVGIILAIASLIGGYLVFSRTKQAIAYAGKT